MSRVRHNSNHSWIFGDVAFGIVLNESWAIMEALMAWIKVAEGLQCSFSLDPDKPRSNCVSMLDVVPSRSLWAKCVHFDFDRSDVARTESSGSDFAIMFLNAKVLNSFLEVDTKFLIPSSYLSLLITEHIYFHRHLTERFLLVWNCAGSGSRHSTNPPAVGVDKICGESSDLLSIQTQPENVLHPLV